MSFIEQKKAAVHKLHSGLIGRQAEIAAVKYALKQLESRLAKQLKVKDYANVFYFHGHRGVGKSTLLQAIYQDCERGELGYQPLSVFIDCRELPRSEASGPENLILALARGLTEITDELKPYFQPLLQAWTSYLKGEAGPGAPSPLSPAAPGPAGPAAPRHNPVRSAYGTMASLQGTKSQNVKNIARNVTKNMQAMEAAHRQPPSLTPVSRDITGELLGHFSKAIDKISAACPVVFFIDHYELLEGMDDWFRNVFLAAFQRELVVVVAGESNLHDHYQYSFGKVADCIRLRPFSRFESSLYLRNFNRLQDEAILEATQNLTGGLPISMAMVSSALQHVLNRATPQQIQNFLAFPNEDYEDQIDQYIAYICLDEFAPADKNLLAVLAIMRHFEPTLFQSLSGVMNAARTLDHLAQRYPFVSPQGRMSPFAARTLRSYFKQEQGTLYDQINQDAYVYFVELANQNPQETAFVFESLYYYFHLQPQAAWQHFLQMISHYLHKDLDICDQLCLAALDASLPKSRKQDVEQIAEHLGAFRKKDSKGAQAILAILSGKSESSAAHDTQHYLNYLEAMS